MQPGSAVKPEMRLQRDHTNGKEECSPLDSAHPRNAIEAVPLKGAPPNPIDRQEIL
ncbi:hypothetical protein SAMD00023353_0403560 [Rosellinia necatrix]|uniref:Uncharacterized protein n=1 Tax=Rosellinia necatrix TaxID=77044 RepID=A0A1S8A606_ROSNE|nr:hypothetical protein SAMD00023353_0403560 [Rosellinia necatrix]